MDTDLAPDPDLSEDASWTLGTTLAGLAAGMVVRKVATEAWRLAAHEDPPENPAANGVSWSEALGWAAATGVFVGFGRVTAHRLMSTFWKGRKPRQAGF